MTLNGNINAASWSVAVDTAPAPQGGFSCQIHVTHTNGDAQFTHTFTHHRTFESETAAVLEGLREGMVWVELKSRHAFNL